VEATDVLELRRTDSRDFIDHNDPESDS